MPETFWNTKKALLNQNTKKFFCDWKSFRYFFWWHPSLWFTETFAPDKWSTPEISKKPRTFHRQNNVQISWSPLCIKFSDTKNFQKHQRDLLKKFSVLWDIKFFEFFVTSPSMVHPNFRTRQIGNADFELFSACSFLCWLWLVHYFVSNQKNTQLGEPRTTRLIIFMVWTKKLFPL